MCHMLGKQGGARVHTRIYHYRHYVTHQMPRANNDEPCSSPGARRAPQDTNRRYGVSYVIHTANNVEQG